VTGDSGHVKANYRQSTFIGAVLSPERMRKRAAGFIPDPNRDYAVDRKVFSLMDRGINIGQIADALIVEFPAQFKSWKLALAIAADLSEKYSK
jgi:hypothetical protein